MVEDVPRTEGLSFDSLVSSSLNNSSNEPTFIRLTLPNNCKIDGNNTITHMRHTNKKNSYDNGEFGLYGLRLLHQLQSHIM